MAWFRCNNFSSVAWIVTPACFLISSSFSSRCFRHGRLSARSCWSVLLPIEGYCCCCCWFPSLRFIALVGHRPEDLHYLAPYRCYPSWYHHQRSSKWASHPYTASSLLSSAWKSWQSSAISPTSAGWVLWQGRPPFPSIAKSWKEPHCGSGSQSNSHWRIPWYTCMGSSRSGWRWLGLLKSSSQKS